MENQSLIFARAAIANISEELFEQVSLFTSWSGVERNIIYDAAERFQNDSACGTIVALVRLPEATMQIQRGFLLSILITLTSQLHAKQNEIAMTCEPDLQTCLFLPPESPLNFAALQTNRPYAVRSLLVLRDTRLELSAFEETRPVVFGFEDSSIETTLAKTLTFDLLHRDYIQRINTVLKGTVVDAAQKK